jgi:hypothetical protein
MAIFTMNGNDTSVRKLLMDVIEIDRATFPLTMWVNRFDEAPLAQEETNTMPTFCSGLTLKREAIINAITGTIKSWVENPVIKALG